MQKHININNMFPPTTHLTLPPYKHAPTLSTTSTTTTNANTNKKQYNKVPSENKVSKQQTQTKKSNFAVW